VVDAFLTGDLELGVEVVAGLGVVGVLEEDLFETRLLPDRAIARLRRTGLEPEPQPAVRRVDESALGTGGRGILRLERSGQVPLLGDPRDDRKRIVD